MSFRGSPGNTGIPDNRTWPTPGARRSHVVPLNPSRPFVGAIPAEVRIEAT